MSQTWLIRLTREWKDNESSFHPTNAQLLRRRTASVLHIYSPGEKLKSEMEAQKTPQKQKIIERLELEKN